MPRSIREPRCEWRENRQKYYILFFDGERQREKSTGTADRADAEAVFKRWLIENGYTERVGPRHPNEITVAEVIEIYGSERAPYTKDPARIGYAITPLLSKLADTAISDLTEPVCRRYYEDRGITADTARRELGVIQTGINYCVKRGVMTQGHFVWRPPKSPPRERWLTRSEAAQLLLAARRSPRSIKHKRTAAWYRYPSRLYLPLFILLGLYTGRRKSAILTLQWMPNTSGGWVDIHNGVIHFMPEGSSETKKRRGRVPIPRRLMTFLRTAYARRGSSRYVLHVDGRPIANVRRGFSGAVKRAGLDGSVTPHTLRHTSATWYMRAGFNTSLVAQWLAMSEKVLTEVYGHHHPTWLNEIKDGLESSRA